jgi:2-phosphosulfolactate phosphatase
VRLTVRHLDDLVHDDAGLDGVDVAVVIDVIRAFTAAPWCLARGARSLFLARSPESAVAAGRRLPGALLLKDGAPDPRFRLANSPAQVARSDLTGRTVIQTTGNGARGAYAVGRVPLVLCASFVTAGATARAVRDAHPAQVLLVVTEGDEDRALADHLADLLGDRSARGERTAYLQRVRASPAGRESLERGAQAAFPGVEPDDLARCLEVDRFSFAMRAVGAGELLRLAPC